MQITDFAVEAVQGLMAYSEVRACHPLELRVDEPGGRETLEARLFNRNRDRARAAAEAFNDEDETTAVWAMAIAIAEADWKWLMGAEDDRFLRRGIDKIRFLKAVSIDLYPLACGCHALLRNFDSRRCASRQALEAASVVIDHVRKTRATPGRASQNH